MESLSQPDATKPPLESENLPLPQQSGSPEFKPVQPIQAETTEDTDKHTKPPVWTALETAQLKELLKTNTPLEKIHKTNF